MLFFFPPRQTHWFTTYGPKTCMVISPTIPISSERWTRPNCREVILATLIWGKQCRDTFPMRRTERASWNSLLSGWNHIYTKSIGWGIISWLRQRESKGMCLNTICPLNNIKNVFSWPMRIRVNLILREIISIYDLSVII